MSEEKPEKIDKQMLPLIYRLILKIPSVQATSLPSMIQGLFWVIVLPLFIGFETIVSILLLVFLPPPVNFAAMLMIPAAILVIFVKVTLERLINWWNGFACAQTRQWDVTQTIIEYQELLEKKKRKD